MLRLPTNPLPEASPRQTLAPDRVSSRDDYARRFHGAAGRLFLQVQRDAVLQEILHCGGTQVLDVGGGHGQLAVPLVQHGYRVTVIGSHADCQRQLARQLPAGGYRFVVGDLLELPFADRSFDIVLAFRLLAHSDRWRQLIGQLCRVARHGVLVDYPDRRSWNALTPWLYPWKRHIEKNTRPYRCYGRRQLQHQFARQGFRKVTFRPQFFWPMVLHRRLNRAWLTQLLEQPAAWTGLTCAFGSPVILTARADEHHCPQGRELG